MHGTTAKDKSKYFPIFEAGGFAAAETKSGRLNFVMYDCYSDDSSLNDYTLPGFTGQ